MKPHLYDDVQEQMDSMLYTVNYDPDLVDPSIAFTTCQSKSLVGGQVCHLYINSTDPELAEYLFMHECGHILYGHTRSMDIRLDKYLLLKIKASFERVKQYFNNDFERYFACFTNFLFNIVMDFEVNSRLFSTEEWNFMQERTQRLLKDPDTRGQWPEDYGFPAGRTWNEYLNMILLDIEKFIVRFRVLELLNSMRMYRPGNGDGTDGFNGRLSEYEYERIKNQCRSCRMLGKELKSIRQIADEHGKGRFAMPTGSMDGFSREGGFLQTKIVYTSYHGMPDLLEKVKKLLRVKKPDPCLRNQLYNINRRKYSTSVIIPKNVKYHADGKPDLYLLFDVSGSVDSTMVHDFISTFQTVRQQFKHTQIVFWSTKYEGECTLDDKIPDLYGGGTDIAEGITYMAEHYKLRARDVLFVISDFCDSMADWQKALKNVECKRYAIDWSPEEYRSTNPGFEKILKNGEKS